MISKDKPIYDFEERDRLIWENFNDLIIVAEPMEDFKIEYINEDSFKRVLGYSNNDLMGKSFLKYVHSDDLIKNKDLKNKFSFDNQIREVRIAAKNSNYLWFDFQIKSFRNKKNQQKLFIILRDISKLKNLELKLKESENKFKKVTNLIPEIRFWNIFTPKEFNKSSNSSYEMLRQNEAIFRTAIDSLPFDFFMINKDGYYITQNKTCKENWGDIIGKHPEDIANDKDTLAVWKENNARAFSGETIIGEVNFKMNGKIGYFYNVITPLYINDRIEYIQGVNIDITERKITEQKLKESEEKFRTIAEQSLLGIAILQDGRFKYVNQRFANMGCRSIDEVRNWGSGEFFNIIHPEDKDMVIEQAKKRQLGIETKFSGYECRCFKKNGEIMWIQNYSKTITFNGKFADLITVIDITDHKLAEQRLKTSEEKYRHLYENSPYAILLINIKGDILDCNLISENFSGFKRNELIGKNVLDISFIPEKYVPIVLEDLKVLLKGESLNSREIQLYNKEGNLSWVTYQASILNYENEKVIQLIIQLLDEKKKAEQELKESEEKFRMITEQSLMGICIIQDFKVKYVNQQIADIYGYSLAEIYNWNPKEFIKVIHPDYRKIVIDQISKKQQGSKDIVKQYIAKAIKRNRKVIWVENYSRSIVYQGRPADLLIQVDITEKKEAEKKLKESEAKYHELFETSPDGVILIDINGNILECNSALEIISGYSKDEFVKKNFRELEIYHENALDVLLEGYNDLFGNKSLPYIEFPIKRKDNNISWVQLNSTLINMKEMKFILAVIHDITSQKQAEEALKRSEEKYRDLLETSSLAVIEIDVKNRKMTYINPKLLDILGYTREELSEERFRNDIIHEKDLSKLLRTNEEAELEFRIIDKQGKEKWLSGKRIPHFNDKGEITSIRVWLDDITEKKLYENLIYELNINFLNFTADIQKNIKLLLNTGLQLLKGDLILYFHEIKSDKQICYQIITSENKIYTFDEKEFSENLFFNELLYEGHDFPQAFFDIHMKKYAKTDPFIKDYEIKGCFGKVIKSHNSFSSAVCVFYKENPIITGQEKLVMFLICDAIEIEQRRWQVQRDLEEQNITLNKINKLKTELFSRTSHELKTPLISIKGFTELLLTLHHSKFDPEIVSILEEIKEGSKRLEKIINLLLESTKLEAGQLELNPSEENLTFLIKFCVKELRGLATLRKQTVSLDLHRTLSTRIDKERIYEVISNLIVNAIKYTPPGGHIQIKSEIKDNKYIISIQDNGIGFTEEEKNQAFKQFGKIERYGQGWDVSTEGSGLGLYITKKLIELHEGKIWLESKGRNKGSTFYFSIPKK